MATYATNASNAFLLATSLLYYISLRNVENSINEFDEIPCIISQ